LAAPLTTNKAVWWSIVQNTAHSQRFVNIFPWQATLHKWQSVPARSLFLDGLEAAPHHSVRATTLWIPKFTYKKNFKIQFLPHRRSTASPPPRPNELMLNFIFCWPCDLVWSLQITNLTHSFFVYVYFYSLHVSGSHVPIIRRIIVSMWHLLYVTLCRWPSGIQEHMLLHTRRSSTQSDIKQMSYWHNNSPDDGHMAARNMYRIEINMHEKLCVYYLQRILNLFWKQVETLDCALWRNCIAITRGCGSVHQTLCFIGQCNASGRIIWTAVWDISCTSTSPSLGAYKIVR